MEDILSLLENGQSNIVVQVSGRDLLEFTDALVQRACESRESLRESQEGEVYLSKKEVKDLLGVCDTTLWHWDRNHYLSPVRVGRKIMYRKAEVYRLLKAK